ncbi:MmgE/PrpD family protein [Amycolatopsis sp. FDAARGOS 1241]|uniref:MmgE/PrpD family protein n=1 Tax=Amycolatopsis sp. FDAARGOS 1241 TaxID=2778070 RepID=UPI00194FDEFA|nr:MmgE/PrpD family protein [Amycolatopsis sp. FDAARGOS 1241]QRP43515.1 MmgE/PrpD family protein [Amycolatopsis sp. FDAARGOS 1241]
MMTTEDLVTAVLTPPSGVALDHAAGELARFHRAVALGRASTAALAVRRLPGHDGDPARTAWCEGTAAACAAGQPMWVAVCAAAAALGEGDPRGAVRAVAIGYGVAARVAAALGPRHALSGWCQETTAGAIGAVAAAGCAAGLTAAPLRHAVGICATQAAGLSAAAETPLGPLQVGKAAGNAVEAVLLSRNGFTSAEQPLEGRRGLYALLSEGD